MLRGTCACDRCQLDAAHRPSCNFTMDGASRASGLAQITRVPDANINFVSCGIYMDGTIVNSTTCFQACRHHLERAP